MNRTRLLMIGVLALVAGAMVSLLVYKNVQQSKNGVEQMGEVIVAAGDLQVGHKISESDIKIIKIA